MIAEKECPFCGLKSVEFNGSQMVCQNCNATGPTYDTKEEAINGWNKGLYEPGRGYYRERKS
jgi:hypothetical protein